MNVKTEKQMLINYEFILNEKRNYYYFVYFGNVKSKALETRKEKKFFLYILFTVVSN